MGLVVRNAHETLRVTQEFIFHAFFDRDSAFTLAISFWLLNQVEEVRLVYIVPEIQQGSSGSILWLPIVLNLWPIGLSADASSYFHGHLWWKHRLIQFQVTQLHQWVHLSARQWLVKTESVDTESVGADSLHIEASIIVKHVDANVQDLRALQSTLNSQQVFGCLEFFLVAQNLH